MELLQENTEATVDLSEQYRYEVLKRNIDTHRIVRDKFSIPADEMTLRRVAEKYVKPQWATGSISSVDALFIYDMVRCILPDTVVEIGTASGGSTTVLLLSLSDNGVPLVNGPGRRAVHTFDISTHCYFDMSWPVGSAVYELVPQLSGGVEFHKGKTAVDAAKMFPGKSISLALIDANHRHPWPTTDLICLLPILKPGAWVILHDINLPALAVAHEQRTGTSVDWHDHGPKLLYENWPFEKICGVNEGSNIGAIQIPHHERLRSDDIKKIVDIPWESQIGESSQSVLNNFLINY